MTNDPSQDTAKTLDAIRVLLAGQHAFQKLEGMEAAAKLKERAAPIVPLLVPFLTSEEYVPVTSRKYAFSGHALLAFEAMQTIEAIGVPPDTAVMKQLLADPQIMLLPEASYDQGAYIGDYSSETLAPAGLAARLVKVMGQDGFDLLNDLLETARNPAKEIGEQARLAIQRMIKLLPDASAESRGKLADIAERMAQLPEAIAPNTHHGFDLRDLAILIKKKLAAVSGA